MTRTIGDLAVGVRSKNAGPFWITIDLFFDDDDSYDRATRSVVTDPEVVGGVYGVSSDSVRIYRLPLLRALKISFPRGVVQGSVGDRDMHAGQQYVALLGLPLDGPPRR